ncbi:MAG: lasso peptide biosynthesis B2 protein [Thermohalobaculum sp.]|nr:lasso peptide biosynthesis B2 protein [Thermohalobaculum sp.]
MLGVNAEAFLELTLAFAVTRLPEKLYFRLLGLTPVAAGAGAPGDPEGAEVFAGQVVGDAVARMAARVPFRALCLQQSIAVHRMLRRRGVASAIVFGLRPAGGAGRDDLAHAWVTVRGSTVSGLIEDLESYAVLARYG